MKRKEAEMSGKEFIETLRREFGWGFQGTFAKAIGVDISTISRWGSDDIRLPLYAETILELLLACKKAGVPLPDRFAPD